MGHYGHLLSPKETHANKIKQNPKFRQITWKVPKNKSFYEEIGYFPLWLKGEKRGQII
jgi:hypothetical protein